MDIDASNTPLEFPCDYPVKVMGKASPEFRARILQVIALHAGEVDASRITERPSRDGTYLSLTYLVQARSRDHLDGLYRELHATGLVLYSL